MMHIFAVLKQWLLQQKETEASKLLEKNVFKMWKNKNV